MDLVYVFFAIICLVSLSSVSEASDLWCQRGIHKEFEPEKCAPNTVDCFKFKCHDGQWPFTHRGCGVSRETTAVGLPNESCFQAEAVCQTIGGTAECFSCSTYLCNLCSSNRLSLVVGAICIVLYLPMRFFLTA